MLLPPIFTERRSWLILLFVLLVVFCLYLPSLAHDFVNWDDDVHLLENPFLEKLDVPHLRAIFSTTVNKTYIPLTSLSLALERHFFGIKPFIYHLDNLLLHLLVTALVYVLARVLGLTRLTGAAAALLFGVHPMHVESVAWVTERKDVLYSVFYLTAVVCYARYVHWWQFENQRLWIEPLNVYSPERRQVAIKQRLLFAAVAGCGFLSVLAKPMALSLPFILLLCDRWSGRAMVPRVFWEKAVVALPIWLVAMITFAGYTREIHWQWPQSLLLAVWQIAFYLRKFIYPDYYALFYEVPEPIAVGQIEYWSSFLVLGFFAAGLWYFRREKLVRFAVLFFALSVFFLIRWDQAADTNIVADRFMYLPSVGFCLLFGAVINKLWRWEKMQPYKCWTVGVAVAGIFVILISKSSEQISVWRNGESLWRHQLKWEPAEATALVYNNLGRALYDQNKAVLTDSAAQEITAHYERAIRIKPDYATAYHNLGELYFGQGRMAAAKEHLSKAVEFAPDHFDAWFLLGRLQQQEGNAPAAVALYSRALQLMPDHPRLRRQIRQALEEGASVSSSLEIYGRARQELLTQ